jgi:hypothetical protein
MQNLHTLKNLDLFNKEKQKIGDILRKYLCILNNKLQKISFKTSFVLKNEND